MFGLFKKKYEDQVQEEYNKLTSLTVDNDKSPIKLKKDEWYLGSMPVTMGTYKNNGNFGYGALTARLKIAKGIYARAGAGKMGLEKSWVYDHPGELHFTTQRIVFNGAYSNKTIPWSKVMEFATDSKIDKMLIGQETGKDLAFEIKEWLAPKIMASVCAVNNGATARKK